MVRLEHVAPDLVHAERMAPLGRSGCRMRRAFRVLDVRSRDPEQLDHQRRGDRDDDQDDQEDPRHHRHAIGPQPAPEQLCGRPGGDLAGDERDIIDIGVRTSRSSGEPTLMG